MLKAMDFLRVVEKEFDVEDVKVNGLQVWQILRWHFTDVYDKTIVEAESSYTEKSHPRKLDKYKKLARKLSNSLWNIKNFNKSYPYILFTDRLEERTIDNKVSDKIAHGLITKLGKDILICVNPIGEKHRLLEEYKHTEYMSTSVFDIKKVREKVEIQIDREDILEEIEKKYAINVNYKLILKDFFGYVEVFKKYLSKTRPKVVFVNCYYNIIHQALIMGCHLNNIKVIEFQHGLINDQHFAYNISKPIGRETFSDYLFVFGDYVKDSISEYFISKENIYSIGNFYIEHVLEKSLNDKRLQQYFSKLREKFKQIAVVTSQTPVEEELIAFLKASSELNKEILYIFIPRNYNKDFSKYGFSENMILHKDIDFYQTASYSDVHLTVYSTCAVEALFFGIPNVLINIHELSKDNFGKLLGSDEYTEYVESPKELVSSITKLVDVDKAIVQVVAQKFYKSENVGNIVSSMERLGLL